MDSTLNCPELHLNAPPDERRCACGEVLCMEMERDSGECVECMARRSILKEGCIRVPGHLLRRGL